MEKEKNVAVQPMKWYKFSIYCSLWVSALLNISQMGNFGGGLIYGGLAGEVYAFFPGLSIVDKGMAAFALCFAILNVVTRFALARFKKIGPTLVLVSNAASIVLYVAYALAAAAVMKVSVVSLFDATTISTVVISLLRLFAERVYYTKRKDLFLN